MDAPTIFHWDGDAMVPIERHRQRCDRDFVVGETYPLVIEEQRSGNSHRHYFASLHEAWINLPDDIATQFPTSEILRKHALILTGWCNETKVALSSVEEARKVAAFLMAERSEYALISVSGNVVVKRTARSQSTRGPNRMAKAEFQRSKDDVLNWVADLIGVKPSDLDKHSRAA